MAELEQFWCRWCLHLILSLVVQCPVGHVQVEGKLVTSSGTSQRFCGHVLQGKLLLPGWAEIL